MQSLGPSIPQTGEQNFHDPTQAGAYSSAESPHDVKLSPEFSIQVTKLLDLPIPKGAFTSKDQVYVLKVYDEKMNKLHGTSSKINGHIEADLSDPHHTLILGNEGVVNVKSEDKVILIDVEREGNLTNEVVGTCTISRLDGRSPEVCSYALTKEIKGVEEVICGIELRVIEPKFNPKANIHKDPKTLTSDQKEGLNAGNPLGYVAMITIDKVTDLPAPGAKGVKPEIFLSFEADEKDYEEHELSRSGPYKLEQSPHNPKTRCAAVRDTTGVRAPLRVGGPSGEGSMYLRVMVGYATSVNKIEPIGISDVFQVRVMESPMTYLEIKPRNSSAPLGGISLKHRLVTEESFQQMQRKVGGPTASSLPQPQGVQEKKEHYVDTTRPGGDLQMKQQLQNLEAQNRADYQRYKQKLPAGKVPGESREAGYRVWTGVDAMFESMGPHPLAGGDSVGPRVVRGYEEDTCEFNDLQRALKDRTTKAMPAKPRKGLNQKPKPGQQQETDDPFCDPAVARLMYDGDPDLVAHRLRPNICRDPDEIARDKNVEWLQNSKYVPIRNMGDQDRETLRLSQYTHEQDSKMAFYDVMPHYRINEDIWGVAAEAKAVKSSMMRPPGSQQKRVKDDCAMA